ncbi:MAG: MG2 domain-containing protein, partial [Planctomycetes bacterium]|nr:MG2 domain-containing protein [Planctomycetota bacterium]
MRPLPLLVLVLANLLAWIGYHHWQEARRAHPQLLERPAEGAALTAASELRWRFDRPMTTRAGGDPVSLAPPLPGEFLWIDPTTLLFLPEGGQLPKATTVAWRLDPAHLAALDGPAAEDAAGTLATTPLTVEAVRLGARLPDGRHRLELDFDDQVDGAALARHLAASCGGAAVALEPLGPATAAALGADSPRRGSRWRFLAGPPAGEGPLEVTVAAGLAGDSGPLGLAQDHRTTHRWDARLQVERVDAGWSEERAHLILRLNRSCRREALAAVLAVEPAVPFTLVERWGGWALEGAFLPATRYTVVVRPPPERSAIEHPLPERLPAWVPEPPPRAWFAQRQGRLGAGDHRLALRVRNLAQVRLQAFRIYDGNLAAWRQHGRWNADRFARPAAERVVPLAAGQDQLVLDLDSFTDGGDGTWQLRASWTARDARAGDHHWGGSDECTVTLADLGLVAHHGEDACTVWALSLGRGEPQAGVRVRALTDRLQEAGSALTGTDGVATLALAALPPGERVAMLVASQQGRSTWLDFAAPALRDGGADSGGRRRQALEAFVWTPRGAFRPGETLQARALVRGPAGTVPPGCAARWRVLRPDLREWTALPATLADGGADLDLALPADLPTGHWRLELGAPGGERPWGSCSFQVEEFAPL